MSAWAQGPPRPPITEAPPRATLPLKIVLYASGVSYFSAMVRSMGMGSPLRFKVDRSMTCSKA